MGEYFQVQDDYLDCYGAPEVIGKVGTDIQDNKCSWLVIQALARATADQRVQLWSALSGQHDEQKINAVKALYLEMGMTAIFEEYEEQSFTHIKKLMSEVQDLPIGVFEFLLNKFYKRSK